MIFLNPKTEKQIKKSLKILNMIDLVAFIIGFLISLGYILYNLLNIIYYNSM